MRLLLSFVLGAILHFSTSMRAADGLSVGFEPSEKFALIDKDLGDECLRVVREEDQVRIEHFSIQWVHARLTSDADFENLFLIRYWVIKHRSEAIPPLIDLLTDRRLVGLKNSADVIIPERVQMHDLEFYGHGWVINDDLFTVAGRASWLLKTATSEDFGTVRVKSDEKELAEIQKAWRIWLARNSKKAAHSGSRGN